MLYGWINISVATKAICFSRDEHKGEEALNHFNNENNEIQTKAGERWSSSIPCVQFIFYSCKYQHCAEAEMDTMIYVDIFTKEVSPKRLGNLCL